MARLVGFVLIAAGAVLYIGNITGLFPSFAFAGAASSVLGLVIASAKSGAPSGLERRPTSLVIVIPALLLFVPMLVGALMLIAENFESGASQGRLIGSALFALVSLAIVSLLMRDLRQRGHSPPPSS